LYLRQKEEQKSTANCITSSVTKCYRSDQITEDELSGPLARMEDMSCIGEYGRKTWREETTWEKQT
jgi:hypothetical protein